MLYPVQSPRMTWRDRIVLVLLWLTFVGLWFRVYGITTLTDIKRAALLLGIVIGLYCVVVTYWVVHNIAIFRRKGPRKGVREVPFMSLHDHLRRYLRYRADIKVAQTITVDIVNESKVFTAGLVRHHDRPIASTRR